MASKDARSTAGNQGDVFKHAVLVSVLDSLLKGRSKKEVFRYVETHAGPGGTLLPKGGQWEHGIGAVPRSGQGQNGPIDRYLANCVRGKPDEKPGPGDLYLGSAGLAIRTLEQAGVPYEVLLHETNPGTQELLRAYVHTHVAEAVQRVGISGLDGYTAVRGIYARDRIDLLLMDPFEREEVSIQHVLDFNDIRNVLIWGPRHNAPPKEKSLPAKELQASAAWSTTLEDRGLTVEKAQWATWGTGGGAAQVMRGCIMAGRFAADQTRKAMQDAAAAVRSAMGWWT